MGASKQETQPGGGGFGCSPQLFFFFCVSCFCFWWCVFLGVCFFVRPWVSLPQMWTPGKSTPACVLFVFSPVFFGHGDPRKNKGPELVVWIGLGI